SRPVNVRVIAATHHDLEQDVAAGRFRKDLFYRLSVFTITPPPLRERRDDIALLGTHFLARLGQDNRKRVHAFTPEALSALAPYDFQGNVRELKNEVGRAFALADDDGYTTADLLSSKIGAAAVPAVSSALRQATDRVEAQLIRETLARNGGNQTRTASELGL